MATDFGKDTLCLDSLLTGRMATGVRVLAQRCYHRLTTPRGTLRGGQDEQNFGTDITKFCGATNSLDLESSLAPAIQNELKKDPQVKSVSVTISSSKDSNGLTTWTIGVDVTSAEGPFRMVLSVDSVTVALLELEA